ncbi:hypothetical protein E4U55_006096 [Claviceps digitariae]|nr:hypothetical protein E4U55_006096 [Claviceps digitariae]
MPQLQPSLAEVQDEESSQAPDERRSSLDGVDNLLLPQEDLIQVLASATLCRSNSADLPHDVFIAEAALASMLLLQYTTESVKLSTLSLAHTAAYTNSHNNWTTKPAAVFANRIMDLQLRRNKPHNLITDMLAVDIPRPRLQEFSNSDSSESSAINMLTSTSLKCIDNWQKFATVLEWALQRAETEYVAGNWHFFVPFLINLTGSHEITARGKALQLIVIFLAKCPAMTLFTTGIDHLLENAIFPLLHFVPPLTLEDDSAIMLATAYQVLTDLAVKNHALHDRSRRRLLDKLLREGVLQTHQHALEHVKVTTVLLKSTTKVVSFLGIFATKHVSNTLHF